MGQAVVLFVPEALFGPEALFLLEVQSITQALLTLRSWLVKSAWACIILSKLSPLEGEKGTLLFFNLGKGDLELVVSTRSLKKVNYKYITK